MKHAYIVRFIHFYLAKRYGLGSTSSLTNHRCGGYLRNEKAKLLYEVTYSSDKYQERKADLVLHDKMEGGISIIKLGVTFLVG